MRREFIDTSSPTGFLACHTSMLAGPVRYYFNLTNDHEVIHDDEGMELSDLRSAVTSAIEAIRELKGEDPLSSHEWRGWRLEIVDEAGQIVQSISLEAPFQN
jgi:hypothetical protein